MKIYQNKNVDTYKKLEKIAFIAFAMSLPNLIVCVVSAIMTRTILVFVDVIVSIGETLHTFFVWITSHKMVQESGDKYNFGLGRLEVFVSFSCDLIICLGMAAVSAGAIVNLLHPQLPQSSLLGFCLLKVINCSFDYIFLTKQVKVYKEHPSKLNQTEMIAYRSGLIQDFIVGIVAVICYLFQKHYFVLYFSPICSLILSLWILSKYMRHIRDSICEITDVSIPLKEQDAIYDIVMEKREGIKKIVSVNCRKLNDKLHVEISLIPKDSTNYIEIKQILNKIKVDIHKFYKDAEVLVVLGEEE